MMIQKATTTDDVMANLAKNIRMLRNARGLSQTALAEECGVCLATINRIEQGHRMPVFSLVCRIADVLGTTTEKLRENLADFARKA